MAEAPTAVKLLTIEDVRQISEDEHPGELVKGEWVEVSRPMPKHGEIMAHIAALIWLYLRESYRRGRLWRPWLHLGASSRYFAWSRYCLRS